MQPGAHNNAMTNIEGLYAFGEVNFAYHGATRLGANALLNCIFDGLFNGMSVVNYVRDGAPSSAPAASLGQGVFDRVVEQEREKSERLIRSASSEGGHDPDTNPYQIAREMGEEMEAACTVVKSGDRLKQTLDLLGRLRERYGRVSIGDAAAWTNQTLSYARAVGDMLILAELIAKGSLMREESRGSHYRTDFPERDDERFLKASVASYDVSTGEHRIEWREVDTSLVRPRARTYGKSASGPAKGGDGAEKGAASKGEDLASGAAAR